MEKSQSSEACPHLPDRSRRPSLAEPRPSLDGRFPLPLNPPISRCSGSLSLLSQLRAGQNRLWQFGLISGLVNLSAQGEEAALVLLVCCCVVGRLETKQSSTR